MADPERPDALYDGVWACASLIHVAREDFATVLRRVVEVTRTGAPLHVSVRDGDGESVSTQGSAATPRPYFETYWRKPVLRSAVTASGWNVSEILPYVGRPGDHWLSVRATKA